MVLITYYYRPRDKNEYPGTFYYDIADSATDFIDKNMKYQDLMKIIVLNVLPITDEQAARYQEELDLS